MRTAARGQRKQEPTVRAGAKAPIYRGRFSPAEHIRYLDLAALKRARKVKLEVGAVSVAGLVIPIFAEVRNGLVVSLRPSECGNCGGVQRKVRALRSRRSKAADAALTKIRDLKLPTLKLPMPIERLQRISIFGIGVTIIKIGGTYCLVIWFTDGAFCYFCLDGSQLCLRPGPTSAS